jgi:hypothetical protein
MATKCGITIIAMWWHRGGSKYAFAPWCAGLVTACISGQKWASPRMERTLTVVDRIYPRPRLRPQLAAAWDPLYISALAFTMCTQLPAVAVLLLAVNRMHPCRPH